MVPAWATRSRRLLPGGPYFELYGKDAAWATETLGLTMLTPRFRDVRRVGIPARLLDTFVAKTVAAGRTVLTVAETGYPLYRLKERFPVAFVLPPSRKKMVA